MADGNVNSSGSSGLKWAIDLLFSKDKDLGLYLLAGLVVMFAVITAYQSGISADGFDAFAAAVGRVLAVVAVMVILLRALRNSFMVRILGNAVVAAGLVYFAAGFVQFLSTNTFHPPLPTVACMANPLQQGCPLSGAYSTAAVDAASTRDVPMAAPPPQPLMAQSTSVVDGVIVSESFILEAPTFIPPDNAIFIQFAGGAISRADLAVITQEMAGEGWNIQGAEQGGERTLVASGLNEVRYFRPEDEAAAIELAQAFSERAGWMAEGDMILRDLSQAGFDTLFEGQLEIWTSPAAGN